MTFALPTKVVTIPQPFLIACEGHSDLRLIDELLQHRNISNCSVGCPSRDFAPDLSSYLKALKGIIDIQGLSLRGVLIVVDADDSRTEAFADACSALTSSDFIAPSRPFSIEGTALKTAVYVMPGEGRDGTLEHLLLEATYQQRPDLERCVDEFITCVGSSLGPESPPYTGNQHAKMRLSSLVGASCRHNPWASAAMIWNEDDNPVPIDGPSFDHLASFLLRFSEI